MVLFLPLFYLVFFVFVFISLLSLFPALCPYPCPGPTPSTYFILLHLLLLPLPLLLLLLLHILLPPPSSLLPLPSSLLLLLLLFFFRVIRCFLFSNRIGYWMQMTLLARMNIPCKCSNTEADGGGAMSVLFTAQGAPLIFLVLSSLNSCPFHFICSILWSSVQNQKFRQWTFLNGLSIFFVQVGNEQRLPRLCGSLLLL